MTFVVKVALLVERPVVPLTVTYQEIAPLVLIPSPVGFSMVDHEPAPALVPAPVRVRAFQPLIPGPAKLRTTPVELIPLASLASTRIVNVVGRLDGVPLPSGFVDTADALGTIAEIAGGIPGAGQAARLTVWTIETLLASLTVRVTVLPPTRAVQAKVTVGLRALLGRGAGPLHVVVRAPEPPIVVPVNA